MNNFTLRTKFILVISGSFIAATLLLLATLSGVTERIITDFALRVATTQAQNDRNKILAVIDREVVLAQKMADDSVLKRWFLSGDDQAHRSIALEQLESYRRLFRDKSFFVTMDSRLHYYVANKTKETTMAILNRDNPADKWYFETIRNVDTFALNLDYNAAIQKTKVWINVIMRDGQGHKIGIVGSGIDITDFLHEIINSSEKGISSMLVDRYGVIQAHENRTMVEQNALERDESKKKTIYSMLEDKSGAEKLKQALQSLTSEKSGVAAFPLIFGGEQTIASVSFMRDIGWYNIVLVDVSHVLKFFDFLPIILASILTLLFVVIIIGYQMNRMILAPLNLLTTASQQMVEGNYSTTVPINSSDEIGALTKSFNVMAVTVQHHTANLEENVRLRTQELIETNTQLEQSQQLIMESLHYASVIQSSILPGSDLFDRLFTEWFMIYKPCDIVGGDLYWLRENGGHILMAIIDCTGHGVPGAFMTMTVNSVLNQIVDTIGADDPARILSEMNRLLQNTLHLRQSGESLVDAGLDIALCSIDPDTSTLTFAGAGLSLYIVSDNTLREIKGNRQRVGYSGSELTFTYISRMLDIKGGAACYAATDGFLDEGGGINGYSFGNDRFNEMLLLHAHLPLKRQGELFEQTLNSWRGIRKQRDDITMVGFRL